MPLPRWRGRKGRSGLSELKKIVVLLARGNNNQISVVERETRVCSVSKVVKHIQFLIQKPQFQVH